MLTQLQRNPSSILPFIHNYCRGVYANSNIQDSTCSCHYSTRFMLLLLLAPLVRHHDVSNYSTNNGSFSVAQVVCTCFDMVSSFVRRLGLVGAFCESGHLKIPPKTVEPDFLTFPFKSTAGLLGSRFGIGRIRACARLCTHHKPISTIRSLKWLTLKRSF